MGPQEKERFRSMMRRVAKFCGIEVLTYAILDNHFHLLIRIPEALDISDDELVQRLGLIYPQEAVNRFSRELAQCRKNGDERNANRLRQNYLYRMYNLSEFMKTLKQRFSIWYNARHERQGHLWDDRFKSVLVEGRSGNAEHPGALWVMAQYIELNAVRAGIVDEAIAYRWCGAAEAVAGNTEAQQGICSIFPQSSDWAETRRVYCAMLATHLENNSAGRQGILAACRVRYFVDGVMLGSQAFIENMFQRSRNLFCSSRKTGARQMRGTDWGELCTVRDFRTGVIEPSQS